MKIANINEEILQRAGTSRFQDIIAEQRMRMAGHVMRLPLERPAKTVITWVPTEGNRVRGRPRETWRRTFLKELEHVGVTWEECDSVAADRSRWRQIAAARCAVSHRRIYLSQVLSPVSTQTYVVCIA